MFMMLAWSCIRCLTLEALELLVWKTGSHFISYLGQDFIPVRNFGSACVIQDQLCQILGIFY